MRRALRKSRTAWVVGALNGLLALATVNYVYNAFSQDGIYWVPWHVAIPYAVFTAWRAAVFVQELLDGSANPMNPILEGMLLLGASAGVYLLVSMLQAAATATATWGALLSFAFWVSAVALFGGIVAAALVVLDILVVRGLHAAHRTKT